MQRFVELKVLANDLHFYWSNSSWLFIKEISQGMQCQGRETHTDTEGHRERRHCFVLFCFVSECHFSCRKETIAQMVVPEAHISSSKVSNKSIVEEDVQKEVRVCDRKGFAERSCSVCNTKKAAAAQEELVNAIPREREREYSSRAAKKRTRWMCLKPVNTSVFSSSQPIPPAPTISTFSFCSPLNKQEHAHACTKPLRRRVWACFATPRERTPTWRRP